MSVLGYGRDEMLAVFLEKTYCLPVFFYNKTLRSTNTILRVVCRLHLYEAHRLFSVYHVFPEHTSNVDIKRGVWSLFARVF